MQTKFLLYFFVVSVVAVTLVTLVMMLRRPQAPEKQGAVRCTSPSVENFSVDKSKRIKKGTIFVSIASYRDKECTTTVSQLFKRAKHPERIFVGAVQQNKEKDEDCLTACPKCRERKEKGQIRQIKMNFKEARGPCFARFLASTLWDGEEFYLQIDSHTQFAQDWDRIMMDQYYAANDPKAVISGYPPTKEQFDDIVAADYDRFPMMCHLKKNKDGLPQVQAKLIRSPGRPEPIAYAGAGLMLLPYKALFDVPFDPHLNFLFFGEELLYSARLWTAGYNIYNPTKVFVSHHYSRPGPKFWEDLKEFEPCRRRAINRVKYLLKLVPLAKVEGEFASQTKEFGLGRVRSIEDYWRYLNFDFKQKKVDMCKVGAYPNLS